MVLSHYVACISSRLIKTRRMRFSKIVHVHMRSDTVFRVLSRIQSHCGYDSNLGKAWYICAGLLASECRVVCSKSRMNCFCGTCELHWMLQNVVTLHAECREQGFSLCPLKNVSIAGG